MEIRWASRAQIDYRQIHRRALDEDARYALNLVAALDSAMRRLLEFPQMGTPVVAKGQRKWRLGKTPYILIYQADAHHLNILRVYHERQDWGDTP